MACIFKIEDITDLGDGELVTVVELVQVLVTFQIHV